ncbi:ATP-dependent DNA helicase RecG [Candidatus Nitrospira bockiana]
MADKPFAKPPLASSPPRASTDTLHALVDRLARPIEFASRDAYAHLSTVKNLGPFISDQVVRALSERVYLPAIETELLALRELFQDFDRQREPSEQQRRLTAARTILSRLRGSGPGSQGAGAPAPHARSAPPLGRPRSQTELWNLPVRYAHGVGPKRALLLERLGITTVEEALWALPWRYEDRSVVTPIARLTPGMEATVCGTIGTSLAKRTARRGMTVLEVTVMDETGSLTTVFFNQPFLERIFKPGVRVMMSGRVSLGRKGWMDVRLDNPRYEVLGDGEETLHVGRLVPIYHETKGLSSRQLRVLMKGLLDEYLSDVQEILPGSVQARHGLVPMHTALAQVHFPARGTDLEALNRGTTGAHRRLAFEECFLLELALAVRQRAVKEETKGIRFDITTPLLGRLQRRLPFSLTPAQQRVIGEILADMASTRPMNRLVQGDVGCGKTVVALHAMLVACGSGYQAALMAPTEILAEQHYLTLKRLVEDLSLSIVLLKSGGTTKGRARSLADIERGEADIVVGTHALIQKGVRFKKLGLAVVDEQHKFGVLQRKTLVEKGYRPDVLVMTATPIPRTLAMTVYGDLDTSVIDALPPGRTPVRTLVFPASQRRRAYQLLQDEVAARHQAYIVYPLVEESEKLDLQAAMQAAERLQAREFRDRRVGLLHGRMKAEEKERTMAAFKRGEIDVLVATTVVEVGVDVPTATVMLIEHAERFGLAQLHQLRGRVGRGTLPSQCLLVASSDWRGRSASPAQQRLEALARSTDGFFIAEEDLRIRGPGEFFGVRQWGVPEFRAANLIRDRLLLEAARTEAFALLADDPHLARPEHRALHAAMRRRWQTKLELASVS